MTKSVIEFNKIGWNGIQHKDGWWIGSEKGVFCYSDHDLARAALTIIWQRDGGRKLNFRIKPFTGANKTVGEYTPQKSSFQAIRDYEKKAL